MGKRRSASPRSARSPTAPLFLATEPGLNALDVYQAPILSWDDLLNACKPRSPTAGIRSGPSSSTRSTMPTSSAPTTSCKKFKVEHESDLAYGKGYAIVNNEFQRVLTKLAFLPYGLVPDLARQGDRGGNAHGQVHAHRADAA
jgi:hypothetical protein